jgi:protein tyrosine phosphatase (PTP) superfamily phosphohydrolase (DUF442 family)
MLVAIGAVLVAATLSAVGQGVTTENVEGVRNFKRLETTVACAGATSSDALPALKKMGFASVVNLRQATEAGADIEGSTTAARTANLNYVHIPFNGQAPEAAAADRFLIEIAKPQNQPAFIHCAGGGRAAAMWMVKRLVIDKWDVARATTEATALGLTSQPLMKWAVEYAKTKSS